VRRPLLIVLAGLVLIAGISGGIVMATSTAGGPGATSSAGSSPDPSATRAPASAPIPESTPGPTPAPTPQPTPRLVQAPLSGRYVSPDIAAQHPIAVMVDDHAGARPQSGFNDADVVWHAPAEGGIPRYMLVYQSSIPSIIGPVRSARQYYVEWAAEVRALYAHVGGSPGSLRTLRDHGNGELVFNADEFRWGGRYGFFWRTRDRPAPHNVYTDGAHLRELAERLGALDGPIKAPWRFAAELPLSLRPAGGSIDAPFRANEVGFDYDRETNAWIRRVSGASPQVDAADGVVVAPRNVIVMLVKFGQLNDGHPEKQRLEAEIVGSGTAWIGTNGRVIEGRWRKASITSPTQFFTSDGEPVTLTIGQTFIQVLETGTKVTIVPGREPRRSPGLEE
jgi:hypothetical protein